MFSFSGFLKGLLIQNEVDRSKQLIIQSSAAATTATSTTLVNSQTSNVTLTLPNITDTIATITGTVANITATSNSTLVTLSALSLPGSQVTGNISGDAANITATTNTTLTTLPSLSLPGSQVSGNIPGDAANILATSNSSLTTLPSLSLPGSQISGDIAGNAANITATSNSSLTTLSSLSLPVTQLTGVLPVVNGGTGDASFSANQVIIAGTTSTGALNQVAGGISGYVLTANGTTSAPTWQAVGRPISINARYYGATATLSTSPSLATYSTQDFDTNSAYSSGTYTIPTTGKYQINTKLTITSAWNSGEQAGILIYHNGTNISEYRVLVSTSSTYDVVLSLSDLINCSATDTITIEVFCNSAGTPTLVTSTAGNVGNTFSIFYTGT